MSATLPPERLVGVRAVSFDLDGTLYELPAMRRALQRLVLRRSLSPLRTWRELRQLLQARAAFQVAREAGGDLAKHEALRAAQSSRSELEARWWVPAIGEVGPRSGVEALLGAFAERSLRLVVSSDHAGEAKLGALGLASRFEAVLSGEALGALKPNPRVLEAALERLGLQPDELLHIGDREDTDGEAARALGVRLWIVPPRGPLELG